jgi:hypothetical protein
MSGDDVVFNLKKNGEKPWPAIWVGIYMSTLLILFLFGMVTQFSSEGFGFFPLIALTTPWSWLLIWGFAHTGTADSSILGSGLQGTFLFYLFACNILSGTANSCILYTVLKRREKKIADDEAWERARRRG